jgi:hypothetical protein
MKAQQQVKILSVWKAYIDSFPLNTPYREMHRISCALFAEFCELTDSGDITPQDITIAFIDNYTAWLRANRNEKRVVEHLKLLKGVLRNCEQHTSIAISADIQLFKIRYVNDSGWFQ